MAFSLAQTAHHELVIKKSRFIACVEPVAGREEAQARVAQLKAEHPDAAHVCWALLAGGQSAANDDGEPGGTAGRPMLEVLRHQDLEGVLATVVRYFGGTLLGVPGLINAYKTVTSLALQTTPIIQKQIEVNYQLHFDYTRMNDVMMIVKQYNCTVVKQETNLFCDVEISIPRNRLEEVLFKLGEMHTVEVRKL